MTTKKSTMQKLGNTLDSNFDNSVEVATDGTAARPVSKAEILLQENIKALPQEIYGTSHYDLGHEFHKHNSLKECGERFSGQKTAFVVGVYRLVKVVKITDKRRGTAETIADCNTTPASN